MTMKTQGKKIEGQEDSEMFLPPNLLAPAALSPALTAQGVRLHCRH